MQQILKRFGRTKTLAETSYFWGVDLTYTQTHSFILQFFSISRALYIPFQQFNKSVILYVSLFLVLREISVYINFIQTTYLNVIKIQNFRAMCTNLLSGQWLYVGTLFRNKRFMLDEMTPVKCFIICHILYIRKPKVAFSTFHLVLLYFPS